MIEVKPITRRRKYTHEEKAQVFALRMQGWSYGRIAARLGCQKSTAEFFFKTSSSNRPVDDVLTVPAPVTLRMRKLWMDVYGWMYLDGLTNEEIAERLGVSKGEVKLLANIVREVLWACGRELPDRAKRPPMVAGKQWRGRVRRQIQLTHDDEEDGE